MNKLLFTAFTRPSDRHLLNIIWQRLTMLRIPLRPSLHVLSVQTGVAVLATMFSLGACAAGPDSNSAEADVNTPSDETLLDESLLNGSSDPAEIELPPASDAAIDPVILIFQAENALNQGDIDTAVLLYTEASELTTDPKVALRALELADQSNNWALTGRAAIRYLELAPDSENALRSATIYYLQEYKTNEAIDIAERFLLLQPPELLNPENSDGSQLPKGNPDSPPKTRLAATIEPLGERMLQIGDWLSSTAADTSHLQFALELSQRYPNLAEAHYVYGVELLRSGDASEAALEAQTAMRLRQGWELPRILEAHAAEAEGERDKAVRILQQAIKRSPRNTTLRLELALLLTKEDQLGEAKEQYLQILGYDQQQPQAIAALGRIAIAEDDSETARNYFQQLWQNPQFRGRASLWLGRLAQAEGDVGAAMNWFMQVHGPEAFDSLLDVGRMLYQQRQFDRANNHFENLRQWFPSALIDVTITQADLVREYGDANDALSPLNKALAKNPENPTLLLARGMIYDDVGSYQKAWQDYARVTILEPENAYAWNAWGYSLTINTTRYNEAERLLNRAIELYPDSPAIIDSVGWLLFKQGEPEAALPHLQKAWDAFKHPEVAAHLGEVLWVLQRPEAAKTIWLEGRESSAKQTVLTETLERLNINLPEATNTDNTDEPNDELQQPEAAPELTPDDSSPSNTPISEDIRL